MFKAPTEFHGAIFYQQIPEVCNFSVVFPYFSAVTTSAVDYMKMEV